MKRKATTRVAVVLGWGMALSLAGGTAPAWSAEAAKADAKKGEALHNEKCLGCHASRFDGDPSKMYTRADRKSNSLAKLQSMVGYCSQQLGLQWFDEDVADVTAYLNEKYYHFK